MRSAERELKENHEEVRTMLFLVISTPQPARPAEVKEARAKFKRWMDALKAKDIVRSFYRRVGRGAVVVFDVVSNDALHEILTEWADIVPAHHDVYPLVSGK
jgi:muconolactone delta-isomerase